MEKSIEQSFNEVEKLISVYKSCYPSNLESISSKEIEELENKAIEIVSGLTNIIKTEKSVPEFQLNERICNVVDDINKDEIGMSIWGFSYNSIRDKYGEPLMSFLKKLATMGLVPQIDKIFRRTYLQNIPLVSCLSSGESKEKFLEEVFNRLPQDYRDRLSKERIGLDTAADENSPLARYHLKLIGWCYE